MAGPQCDLVVEGAMQNKLAQYRQVLDVVYFVATYQRTIGHVLNTRDEFTDQTTGPLTIVPTSVPLFVVSTFCSDLSAVFPQKHSGEKKTNKHKQFRGIVPEMGGGQIVYVFPFCLGENGNT